MLLNTVGDMIDRGWLKIPLIYVLMMDIGYRISVLRGCHNEKRNKSRQVTTRRDGFGGTVRGRNGVSRLGTRMVRRTKIESSRQYASIRICAPSHILLRIRIILLRIPVRTGTEHSLEIVLWLRISFQFVVFVLFVTCSPARDPIPHDPLS
jgi:hypothetical protein